MAKQNIPPAPPPGWQPSWIEESEAYLIANGWKRMGVNRSGVSVWEDGMVHEKPKLVDVFLPKKGSPDGEIIKQLQCPPVPWAWPLEVAVREQKARDEKGTSLANRIASKKRELEALEAQVTS